MLLFLLLAVMAVGYFNRFRFTKRTFRMAICDPLPASLQNLRSSFDRSIQDGLTTIRYRVTFSVSSNDLRRIVDAKPFEPSDISSFVTNRLAGTGAEAVRSNGQFYVYARVNRRDFLWVDETGTNCLYLYELVDAEPRR